MTRRHRSGLSLGSLSMLAMATAGCVESGSRLSTLTNVSLGRTALGEPCEARPTERDPAIKNEIDKAYSISCRNVSASISQGTVRIIERGGDRAPVDATLDCGAAREVTLTGIGPVQARRCHDKLLGKPSVAFEKTRGGRLYMVSALATVLGPAEEALRIFAGYAPTSTDGGRATAASLNADDLGPAPGGAVETAGIDVDPREALSNGIDFNHKGLHVQASRVLNDALSRLPANTAPALRAELLLEAALADSNIRFNESAQEHFGEADTLLTGVGGPDLPFLQRKRDAYRALDLLNQRKFREALAALDRLVSAPVAAGEPLRDPNNLRLLNQPARADRSVNSAVAVPETAVLQQLVLDAQASWARSVALLTLGDAAGAQTALDRATAAFRPLINERIDPTLILWLGAHINRQQGRLQARAKDYPAAIASFDRALVQLRQGALNTAGTGNEPTIAETALERAGLIADQGGDPVRIRREYDQAVDAIIVANQSGGSASLPQGIERYLDLLIAEAKAAPTPDTYERFFRAVQAVGEPAVARQLNQLQSVVNADPAIGVKVRDRADLERDITKARYAIAAAAQAGQPTAELDAERTDKEARLLQIDAELGASAKFRQIDDRPATVADLRRVLKPGEGFFKIVELNRRAYGLFVDGEQTFIYPIAIPKRDLDDLAAQIRASIDSRVQIDGKILPFKVEEAYTLFALLTGPAIDAVRKATALVVDPAGPLQNLPASVLITDRASVDRYVAARKAAVGPAALRAAVFDYTKVSFLASRATISTAVSPRSFLVARALPPSAAKQPFLGLGEHVPPAGDGGAPRQVNVGFGCTVSYAALAGLSRQLRPINRKELTIAATALGVPDAPEVVGQDFSDTAVEKRGDLADFEVIHFATHGLEEGVWGCNKSPPALVTSFGDANSDGLLSFSEIAGLRLDANLVVLSACDTAAGVKDQALARRSGQEEAGSTLEGLVRAFLTANTRAVLATLWPVSAAGETDEFIKTFYSVARQRTIGGSLQAAQETLMANPEYSHPFYWGPYFVVGDSTKMMLSGDAAKRVAAR